MRHTRRQAHCALRTFCLWCHCKLAERCRCKLSGDVIANVIRLQKTIHSFGGARSGVPVRGVRSGVFVLVCWFVNCGRGGGKRQCWHRRIEEDLFKGGCGFDTAGYNIQKKGNLGAEKGEEKNNGSRQIMEDTAGQGHSAKDSPKVTQCMPCRIPKGKVGKMS